MNKLEFSEADQLYKTIGEVSAEIGVPPHVLRFWESKFFRIKPHKRKGGHRYYNKADVEVIYQIKKLLYDEGFTIKGAQKYLREKGFMQQTQSSENQQNLFLEEKSSIVQQHMEIGVEKSVVQENIFEIRPQVQTQQQSVVPKVDNSALEGLLFELESIKKNLETK